jgi:uncharacterized tellurite resistance protein B-like protein
METINFDKILLKSAFCCMAADGKIDEREISLIKSMCEKSPFFIDFDFQSEINILVEDINSRGKNFIKNYFDLLKQTQLTEEEELTLIDFAIQTIKADEQIEYSEIKFFKNIRHRLSVTDEKILERYPDIDHFLEEDIITDNFLEKITSNFFELSELPKFDLISISVNALNTDKQDE